MLNELAINTLSYLVNKVTTLDPQTHRKLTHHTGKTIALRWESGQVGIDLSIEKTQIRACEKPVAEPTVTISSDPITLLKLLTTRDPTQQNRIMRQEVTVTGDMEFAQELQQIFSDMDIDWEEHLSYFTGDVVAHHVGNIVRDGSAWFDRCIDHTEKNTTEYLQEELRQLPPREEVNDFFQDIALLRDDVARLAAKLDWLEAQA